MGEKEHLFGEISFVLVIAPFVLALALFGCTLAVLSGRLLLDVVTNGGRISVPVSAETR